LALGVSRNTIKIPVNGYRNELKLMGASKDENINNRGELALSEATLQKGY